MACALRPLDDVPGLNAADSELNQRCNGNAPRGTRESGEADLRLHPAVDALGGP